MIIYKFLISSYYGILSKRHSIKIHFLKVVLVNKINNESFQFKCGRWLAKDELDHQIELEIKVDETNTKKNPQSKSI